MAHASLKFAHANFQGDTPKEDLNEVAITNKVFVAWEDELTLAYIIPKWHTLEIFGDTNLQESKQSLT